VAIDEQDMDVPDADLRRGKSASQWMLMARSTDDLGSLARNPRWRVVHARQPRVVWTDDFSNPLAVLNWHR